MDTFASELLMLILDEKLSDETWDEIIRQMIIYCKPKKVNQIFEEVISDGNIRLIEMFSKNGVDAFEYAKDDTSEDRSPPIFSLIGCTNENVKPENVLDAIFNGWKTYRMQQMSSLFRGNHSLTRQMDDRNLSFKTLLNEAILEGDEKLTDYLIDFSDATASSPYGRCNALHCAVLTNNEKIIEKLLKKGLDPYDELRMYPSDQEIIRFGNLYFQADYGLCKRALDDANCFELAESRKPSNLDFLKKTYDGIKNGKKKDEVTNSEKTVEKTSHAEESNSEILKWEEEKTNEKYTEVISNGHSMVILETEDSNTVKVVDEQGQTNFYDLSLIEDRNKARRQKSPSKLYTSLLEELKEFVESSKEIY